MLKVIPSINKPPQPFNIVAQQSVKIRTDPSKFLNSSQIDCLKEILSKGLFTYDSNDSDAVALYNKIVNISNGKFDLDVEEINWTWIGLALIVAGCYLYTLYVHQGNLLNLTIKHGDNSVNLGFTKPK